MKHLPIFLLLFLISCNQVVHRADLEVEKDQIQNIIPRLCSSKWENSMCWGQFDRQYVEVKTSKKYQDHLYSIFTNQGYKVEKNESGLKFDFTSQHLAYKKYLTHFLAFEHYLFLFGFLSLFPLYRFLTRSYREMVKKTKENYKQDDLLFWNRGGHEELMNSLKENRLPVGWNVHFDGNRIVSITKTNNHGFERIASCKESVVKSFRR